MNIYTEHVYDVDGEEIENVFVHVNNESNILSLYGTKGTIASTNYCLPITQDFVDGFLYTYSYVCPRLGIPQKPQPLPSEGVSAWHLDNANGLWCRMAHLGTSVPTKNGTDAVVTYNGIKYVGEPSEDWFLGFLSSATDIAADDIMLGDIDEDYK